MKELTLSEFIKHISNVIMQPELHMREIPILIGLGILLIFIFLVLIAIIFVHPSGSSTQQVEERQLKASIRRRYMAGTIVGFLAIASLGLTMTYASKSEFCAGCHEMRAAHKSFEESVHKEVACLSCHQEPGISGVFVEKLQLVEMVIAKSGVVGSVSEGPVSNAVCLRCHKSILSEIKTKRIVRMKHEEPIEAGFKCLDCHFSGNLFHSDKRRVLDKFGMSLCVGCHNQKKASAECGTCHLSSGEIPASIKRDEYLMVNLPDKISCNKCHSTKTCLSCHSLQLPHPEGWEGEGHSLEAFVNKKLCWECHAQADCRKCHAGTLPHEDDWVKKHGPASKSSSAPCSSCHVVEKFCQICHTDTGDFKLKAEPPKPKTSW